MRAWEKVGTIIGNGGENRRETLKSSTVFVYVLIATLLLNTMAQVVALLLSVELSLCLFGKSLEGKQVYINIIKFSLRPSPRFRHKQWQIPGEFLAAFYCLNQSYHENNALFANTAIKSTIFLVSSCIHKRDTFVFYHAS